jgi:hypothetical protein
MKGTKIKISIFYISFFIGMSACFSDKEKKQELLITKQIHLPDLNQLNCISLHDTLNCSLYYSKISTSNCKIIIYADTLNCIDCDLNLIEWKQRIRELEKRKLDVNFIFILNPNYLSDVKQIIHRDSFSYPIFFEKEKSLFRQKNFPPAIKFITLLLNKENEVILIGNPINNETIWELYIDKIRLLQSEL